jgi:hypothetical protein
MNRTVVLFAMLCGVLVAPVWGGWIYEGTTSYISQPYDAWDPNGTWYYGWDGDGSVDADAFSLEVDGWTSGYCGVWLAPAIEGHGLAQFAWASSYVNAQSSYRWEAGGSKAIAFRIVSTISSGWTEYAGRAGDDTHVSVVSCNSGAEARAGGGVSQIGYHYPRGWGSGWATTQSGSGALNDSEDVTVSWNMTDWGYPPPFLYNVWYEGELGFTASTEDFGYRSFEEPWINSFVVSTVVSGNAVALGEIEINDPEYFHLGLAAHADYAITGQTRVDLYGNIQ